ncbi:unnamed protein product [Owenia fusiformis]|uniref:Uncharacterized protein n=1 Tax=Owenia fusiformis TaxID=6347 RepID=A0A8J1T5U8_OWEFU|nr:unnamed protein product [Owenia fusiformis]
MGRRTISLLRVIDVDKRRIPDKHYVYVIQVTWSDGITNIVYRRYSKFFDFQTKLLDKFPIEAGLVDPSQRMIPFLPGKILFGRSQIRRVAEERQKEIDAYCQALIKLPTNISECDDVLNFFTTKPEDINPVLRKPSKKKEIEHISEPLALDQYIAVAKYDRQQSNEVSLKAGMAVEVVERNETGWWFVVADEEQGWAPCSYLEKEDGTKENGVKLRPGKEERYVCNHAYSPMNDDEIQLHVGLVLEVIEKNPDGWWKARHGTSKGWVPAAYLDKADSQQARVISMIVDGPVEHIQTPLDASSMKPKVRPKTTTPSSTTTQGNMALHISPKLGRQQLPPRKNSVKAVSAKCKAKPPRPQPPNVAPHTKTTADFQSNIQDGISFRKGQNVKVLQRSSKGWWYVDIEGEQGWAPTHFIECHDKQDQKSVPIQSGSNQPQTTGRSTSSQAVSKSINKLQKTGNSNQTRRQNTEASKLAPASKIAAVFEQSRSNEAKGGHKLKRKPTRPSPPKLKGTPLGPPKPQRGTINVQYEDDDDSEWDSDGDVNEYENIDDSWIDQVPNAKDTPVEDSIQIMANVIHDFEAASKTEISVKKGSVVEVLDMNNQHWWLVKTNNEEGWVSRDYLLLKQLKGTQANKDNDDNIYQNASVFRKPSLPAKPKHVISKKLGIRTDVAIKNIPMKSPRLKSSPWSEYKSGKSASMERGVKLRSASHTSTDSSKGNMTKPETVGNGVVNLNRSAPKTNNSHVSQNCQQNELSQILRKMGRSKIE